MRISEHLFSNVFSFRHKCCVLLFLAFFIRCFILWSIIIRSSVSSRSRYCNFVFTLKITETIFGYFKDSLRTITYALFSVKDLITWDSYRTWFTNFHMQTAGPVMSARLHLVTHMQEDLMKERSSHIFRHLEFAGISPFMFQWVFEHLVKTTTENKREDSYPLGTSTNFQMYYIFFFH